jgi:hypothetical protein
VTKDTIPTKRQTLKLDSLITNALTDATEGLDVRKFIHLAGLVGENDKQLSEFLKEALISFVQENEYRSETLTLTVVKGGKLNPLGNNIPPYEDIGGPYGKITFTLDTFLKNDELEVSGEEMVKRAVKNGPVSGQCHAHAFHNNKELIPPSWRNKVLLFTGAFWPNMGLWEGKNMFVSLWWSQNCWETLWCRLKDGDSYDNRYRIVRPVQN